MTAAEPLWQSIAQSLSAEIAQGIYAPGDRLPTEAKLSARFGVNRHTVRHALAQLAEQGLVHSRRGAGVFVHAAPTEYPLGRRVRFHQNLTASGRTPARRLLALDTRRATTDEAQALALSAGAMVHVYEGLSTSDGMPVGLFRSVFPASRFPGLCERLQHTLSVTEALAAEGLSDYTRASTRITAKIARGTRAALLHLSEGAPLLRTVAINVDDAGVPVEFGTSWFAGDRVTLVVAPE
ncbi:MAG: phosphonate metabolism transcriptional regulator PhnF [Paracoccaceae bacterium]|nr:MAG: phosphonate metabolism transcriptional regulator PhnF [Paracoccaceae bacterium]